MYNDEIGLYTRTYISTNFIYSNFLTCYKILQFLRTGKATFCCVKSQTFVPWGNVCTWMYPLQLWCLREKRNLYAHNNRATGPSGIYAVASCRYSKSDGWSLSCWCVR